MAWLWRTRQASIWWIWRWFIPSNRNGLAKEVVGTLATEAIRGEGGILLNSRGDRFMKSYYPQRMELGHETSWLAQFITKLCLAESTKHGGVWLDVTHLPKAKIMERLPSMHH